MALLMGVGALQLKENLGNALVTGLYVPVRIHV